MSTPHRIVIIGCPGAGKTTLARRLADDVGVQHIEIDSLFHQPGWQRLAPEDFRASLVAAMDAADDGWVMCGNYINQGAGLHHQRATTIIWLDLPRRDVMQRMVRRTFRRWIRREQLWNGNREPFFGFLRRDPEKNIILWAWQKHPVYRAGYVERLRTGEWDHVQLIRIVSADELDRFDARQIRRSAAAEIAG